MLSGFCGTALAEAFTIGGTGAAIGTMQLLANEFSAGHADVSVATAPNLGTAGAIRAVLEGAIGLAVTARPLSDAERKLGAVEVEYARTPFVFAVSADTAATAITTRELAHIYAGNLVAWPDGTPIRIALRPVNDVDTEIVRSMSSEIRSALTQAQSRRGLQHSVTDQEAASFIERTRGALGPSTLALIASEMRALRALQIDGKVPTPENAASGAYPYHKRLFMVTGARRSGAVERFIAFVQSPAGRRIIVANGQWVP